MIGLFYQLLLAIQLLFAVEKFVDEIRLIFLPFQLQYFLPYFCELQYFFIVQRTQFIQLIIQQNGTAFFEKIKSFFRLSGKPACFNSMFIKPSALPSPK